MTFKDLHHSILNDSSDISQMLTTEFREIPTFKIAFSISLFFFFSPYQEYSKWTQETFTHKKFHFSVSGI